MLIKIWVPQGFTHYFSKANVSNFVICTSSGAKERDCIGHVRWTEKENW